MDKLYQTGQLQNVLYVWHPPILKYLAAWANQKLKPHPKTFLGSLSVDLNESRRESLLKGIDPPTLYQLVHISRF
jgi:hypothetical protein